MLDSFFIFGAQHLIYFAITAFVVFFLFQSRNFQKKILLLSIFVLPLSYLIAKFGSVLFYNPRPFVGHFAPLISHAADNGFPSDHTLLMAALSSILIPFNKKVSIVFWCLTLLVGISRVYAGVHHSLDIIASIAIAFIVTWIVILFLRQRNWI